MDISWRKEVEELHEFFGKWYRSQVLKEAISRVSDVLADEFHIVTPEGHIIERDRLLQMLESRHGSMSDMEMQVEDIRLRFNEGGVIIVTYQEWGQTGKYSKRTMISAVLRSHPDKPNGLEWLHVHESLMPGK